MCYCILKNIKNCVFLEGGHLGFGLICGHFVYFCSKIKRLTPYLHLVNKSTPKSIYHTYILLFFSKEHFLCDVLAAILDLGWLDPRRDIHGACARKYIFTTHKSWPLQLSNFYFYFIHFFYAWWKCTIFLSKSTFWRPFCRPFCLFLVKNKK